MNRLTTCSPWRARFNGYRSMKPPSIRTRIDISDPGDIAALCLLALGVMTFIVALWAH